MEAMICGRCPSKKDIIDFELRSDGKHTKMPEDFERQVNFG